MNLETFFNAARQEPFGGHLTTPQVEGCELLLTTNTEYNFTQDQLAYVLATAFHETAHTMQPVEEFGKGKGHVYGLPDPQNGKVYYGRGYVQLTWRKNYQHAGDVLGFDLVNDPALALRPDVAADILFAGLRDGWFAGNRSKLNTYINDDKTDYLNARRLVNGTDCAKLIEGYARAFAVALT